MIAEQLLDGEAETVVRTVVKWAKSGNMTALRLCLDRILPPRRDRPVRFTIPELNSAEDAVRGLAAISAAVARGELTPSEAAELSRVIETFVKAIETSEIEGRSSLAKPMRNGTLHRRLAEIEARFDQAAKAIEREGASIAEKEISAEQAERTYRQLMKPATRSEGSSKLTVHQAAALYFREVRSTPCLKGQKAPSASRAAAVCSAPAFVCSAASSPGSIL